MKKIYISSFCALIALAGTVSCSKNFPSLKESFSLDMNFSRTEYTPNVGRNTYYNGNFSSGQSTLPLNFRISSVRTFNGSEAPELLKLFPISVWKERYTGNEKSLEELKAKREIIMKPLWEIGEHSGTFTLWENSNSTILKTFPDSCYYFDVEVSSEGGSKFFRNLKLIPRKEIDYEPYVENGSVRPNSLFMFGDSTQNYMSSDNVKVWFNRLGDGNSLTFKMLSPDLKPIKLSKFNTTKWDELVHGFNKRFNADSTSVTYDVEYPIPLVKTVDTKYIKNGNAQVRFSYDLKLASGIVLPNFLDLNFSIYKKGNWEIVMYYTQESPMFTSK